MSSRLVISMAISHPYEGADFGVFLVADGSKMVSGNRTILLGILKGLQMRCHHLMRQASIVFGDALCPPN